MSYNTKSILTYITIGIIGALVITGIFHIHDNRTEVQEGSWLVCGSGFFYDMDTMSGTTYETMEWLANECAPRYQLERTVPDVPIIGKEFNSWSGKEVGYTISEQAVIIYPNLLVVNWECSPETHHRMFVEAMKKRDAIASR